MSAPARVLKLEVPVLVVLSSRQLALREVTSLVAGAIIEFAKSSDEELELLVNNKVVATGTAVKVGENFGIRINFVGDVRSRVRALAADPDQAPAATAQGEDSPASKGDAAAPAPATPIPGQPTTLAA